MSSAHENKIISAHILRDLVRIVILIAADLLSKWFIFSHHITAAFISPVINTGAAWSINLPVAVLICVAVIVCGFGIFLYYKRAILSPAFVLLFAGAIGNLYDRIALGGVRDFISVGQFPVFNVADILITFGVLCLAFQYKQQSRLNRK